jgi:hypothetical protein
MAKMIRLDPALKEPLREGWELIATEAGRYAKGLRATVQLWNGSIQGAAQLAPGCRETWDGLMDEVVRLTGLLYLY